MNPAHYCFTRSPCRTLTVRSCNHVLFGYLGRLVEHYGASAPAIMPFSSASAPLSSSTILRVIWMGGSGMAKAVVVARQHIHAASITWSTCHGRNGSKPVRASDLSTTTSVK
ncbi:unnamed protein product [Prorocentrum cordatum]|uniref:Uncharacterized protein n=1 Tax=Prorocentrum cordatum TaxID=2364126 RepID=A0ABN9UGR7_9DINO|nr:unnamed protein product [Polarella glacialis]